MKREEIIKDFKAYLEANKQEDLEEVVNDFFSNLFYDLEDENDLNEVNEAEATIRKELGLDI